MTSPTPRLAEPTDKPALMSLATATGLFQPHELGVLDHMLTDYFHAQLEDHRWTVIDASSDESTDVTSLTETLDGAAYVAPEIMGNGIWNLYFIGVQPQRQGHGLGGILLAEVEHAVRIEGARLLLVETSGLGSFDLTRQFYRKNRYDEEARIRDYYGPGDDKVIFRKAL